MLPFRLCTPSPHRIITAWPVHCVWHSQVSKLRAELNNTLAALAALDRSREQAGPATAEQARATPSPWQPGWRRWQQEQGRPAPRRVRNDGTPAVLADERGHERGMTTTSRRRTIVYRGTHASLYKCAEYADPLRSPSPASAHDVTYAARLHRSNANAWYNWRAVYAHHRLDQDVARAHGVPYMNTFLATSLRPGGRLDAMDCNHFCLPGPVDEWTRLLLAFLMLAGS